MFILGERIVVALLIEREGECEIGRVPRHRSLALDVKSEIGHRETFGHLASDGVGLDGIFLCLGGGGIEGILEEYILIEGIIFGSGGLLRTSIIDRGRELCLRRHDLAHITLHHKVILVVSVDAALSDALIYGTKAGALMVVREIDHCHIRK